jgi:hypothetical protein
VDFFKPEYDVSGRKEIPVPSIWEMQGSRALLSRRGYSPLCQSASRVKLIRGLLSTSKAEDLWTTRLATAYCRRLPFSSIVVALRAV